MNKINFVNNSEPALSAETLNQMQDNMEEATTIETITSENNVAIKFPDGTMECYNIKDRLVISQGATSVEVNFPVAFVTAPTVVASFSLHNGVQYPVNAGLGYGVTTTKITFYTDVTPTGTNYVLNYIAKGRWK